MFEFVRPGRNDSAKNRANRHHVWVLLPDGARQRLHEIFAQTIVWCASDLVEQPGEAQARRGAVDAWQAIFHATVAMMQLEYELESRRNIRRKVAIAALNPSGMQVCCN